MLSLAEVMAGTGAPKRQAGNRYRKDSIFVADELAIGRPLDRNDRARILFCAEALERRTKEPGRRNGALGYVGLTILRALLLRSLNGRNGLCCPSYVTLQACTGLCRASIAAGLERLERSGIIKVVRRIVRQVIERISPITGNPERIVGTVQASNLYAFPVPAPSRVCGAGSNYQRGSINKAVDDTTNRRPAALHRFVSEAALDQVRAVAPGWDRQWLLARFLAWPGSKQARDMDKAFLAWVRSFTKGKAPC
jgi:hypothetical protein